MQFFFFFSNKINRYFPYNLHISAPTAFGGFGTTLGGFGTSSAAPSFSFNTPPFGATAPSTGAFGGFGSCKFFKKSRIANKLLSVTIQLVEN